MTNGYQFEVVPYEAAHGLDMAPDVVDQYAHACCRDVNWAETLAVSGVGLTLMNHGKPIMAGGMVLLNSQTAEWRILLNKSFSENFMQALRLMDMIRSAFHDLMNDNPVGRVQCAVPSTFDKGLKLARHLGFKEECTMKEFFTDASDLIIMRYEKGSQL